MDYCESLIPQRSRAGDAIGLLKLVLIAACFRAEYPARAPAS